MKAIILAAAITAMTAAGALANSFDDFEIDTGGVAASDFDCAFNFTRGEPPCGKSLPVQRTNGEENAKSSEVPGPVEEETDPVE